MKIRQLVSNYLNKGFTLEQAQHNAAQELLVKAIDRSKFKDKIVYKGGLVLYHISNNIRRTTTDIDFDFISFDISSDKNIDFFIEQLNDKNDSVVFKRTGEITTLHHQDYKGKRVNISIKDGTYLLTIKLDIGIHTLLFLDQKELLVSFTDNKELVTIKVNPPEQMIAEKLISLSKIGIKSTRYKDVYDIYYLLERFEIDKEGLINCINLISGNVKKQVINNVITLLSNNLFLKRIYKSNANWLGIKTVDVIKTLNVYLMSI